jgi:metal-sulfur cluster biosynthetic enzyme
MDATLRDKIEDVLRTVYDPEIPVNIMELGLVYEIKISEGGKVKITMTLTAPACPVTGDIILEVETKVRVRKFSYYPSQFSFGRYR